MTFGKENLLKNHVTQDDISGFLAEGTELKGEIRFREILRVDGKISGKIESDGELVVGESGEVDADVKIGTLSVSGKVKGTICVKEKMEIHPKGRVEGDLILEKPNLVIHEGGIYEGKIDMTGTGMPKGNPARSGKGGEVEPFRRHGSPIFGSGDKDAQTKNAG